jgi:hypothetical protein
MLISKQQQARQKKTSRSKHQSREGTNENLMIVEQ